LHKYKKQKCQYSSTLSKVLITLEKICYIFKMNHHAKHWFGEIEAAS